MKSPDLSEISKNIVDLLNKNSYFREKFYKLITLVDSDGILDKRYRNSYVNVIVDLITIISFTPITNEILPNYPIRDHPNDVNCLIDELVKLYYEKS